MAKRHTNSRHHVAQVLLDSLTHGSVVLDNYGHAWQLSGEYWYRSYGDDSEASSFEVAALAPITVIHEAPKRDGLPVSGGY